MKYIVIRAQVIFLSVILLVTFGLLLALADRFNMRFDFTPGRMYSLAEGTSKVLKAMPEPIEIIAFYPHDDPARKNFEVFLKQCQMLHPDFRFSFYDPHRAPNLAKSYNVQELYTVILQYQKHTEKLVQPTEQSFTNSLVKLLQPKTISLCFTTGHKEASVNDKEKSGYSALQDLLKDNGYEPQEIILSRDKVPPSCPVLVVAGPHQEFDKSELSLVEKTFQEGRGVLFLIDPIAAGEGKSFVDFMRQFGVALGQDVIVDKASRMVGGDFLVALVSQYVTQHAITSEFQEPTFFPVTRSVQPAVEAVPELEVIPLALSSPESWSETNLEQLSKGEATFDSSFDVMGPIPIAAAVEATFKLGDQSPGKKTLSQLDQGKKSGGRMVVIGDSDFLTNGFINFSGNIDLALNTIQWLAKDDRLISLNPRGQEFKPLLTKTGKQFVIMMVVVVVIPVFFLALGFGTLFRRKRAA